MSAGRRLFDHAVERARQTAHPLEWATDTNAPGFCLAMGGVPTGMTPSDIPGDELLTTMPAGGSARRVASSLGVGSRESIRRTNSTERT
ncbi:MAG: hypothetical protein M3406_11560 [Chloroflexota bacterium]|nr:hypothetical protein [Chloroflexota bacterium]